MFFGGGALFWQLFLFGEPSGSPLLAVYGLLCLFLFGRSPVLAVYALLLLFWLGEPFFDSRCFLLLFV